jgi:alpha-D-ribose 1-methylphosphonate 5-triphosphate diphosphatase PhnM
MRCLNPTHGLGLSGVVACHTQSTEKVARPRPAARSSHGAAHVLRARQVRCGVVTVRNSRAGRRDGALVGGTVAASRWQVLG